jgi:hypothetical protein
MGPMGLGRVGQLSQTHHKFTTQHLLDSICQVRALLLGTEESYLQMVLVLSIAT